MQQDRTHSRVGCPLEHRRRDSIALTSHQWIMKPAVWQLKLVRRLVSHLVLYVLCMYTEEFMVGSMTLRSCCCKTSPNHHTSTISSWYKMFQLIGLFRFSHYSLPFGLIYPKVFIPVVLWFVQIRLVRKLSCSAMFFLLQTSQNKPYLFILFFKLYHQELQVRPWESDMQLLGFLQFC